MAPGRPPPKRDERERNYGKGKEGHPDAGDLRLPKEGLLGGGQIGYNWQVSSFVFGLEGDVAGVDWDDLIVDVETHSTRLHRDVPQSELVIVPGTGHMVHYAAPQVIVAAIDKQSSDVVRVLPEAMQASKGPLKMAA